MVKIEKPWETRYMVVGDNVFESPKDTRFPMML